MSTFNSLDLSPKLKQTLAKEGYETPTPIQAEAIPPVLEGSDLLGCAQTGTGKTAAFSLPLIELLLDGDYHRSDADRRARALILAPTRELAAQIEQSLRTYGRGTGLRGVVIYGGVGQRGQVRQLREGVDVIVATPGRLLDLMNQGHVDLSGIEMFVLDEADRMLDMGFIDPIRRIGREIPESRQTLFFSATMPPKIRQLADSMLSDPVFVSVTPPPSEAPLIEQGLFHVPGEQKLPLLTHLLDDPRVERAVVFTKTKHGAEKLAIKLSQSGVSAGAIHGNKSQSQRQRALDAFRGGRSRVLVATDVAARGLDVDGITHVFNYNLPMEPEAYVHRIGRTGRAGATGHAVSFCSRDERGLLRAIERLTRLQIPTLRMPDEIGEQAQEFSDAARARRHDEPGDERRSTHTPRPRPSKRKQEGAGNDKNPNPKRSKTSRRGRAAAAGGHPIAKGSARPGSKGSRKKFAAKKHAGQAGKSQKPGRGAGRHASATES